MSLIALVLGLFFVANIRKPMRVIQQGIATITHGNLETRIHLGRRDEWRLIEEALNLMTAHLGGLITQVQHAGIQVTTSATRLAASGKQLESTVTEQVASTNQVVATTEEIAATSQELAQTMQRITAVADETATAAQSLLGRDFSVSRQRGELAQSELAPHVIATVHPSSLLRMRDETGRIVSPNDFNTFADFLLGLPSSRSVQADSPLLSTKGADAARPALTVLDP